MFRTVWVHVLIVLVMPAMAWLALV